MEKVDDKASVMTPAMKENELNHKSYVIHEDTLYQCLNEITCIHNQIVKNEMFHAGYNMCVLQNKIVTIINRNKLN